MVNRLSSALERRVRDAAEARKDLYPFHTMCAECGREWASHKGELCPSLTAQQGVDLYHAVVRGVLPRSVLEVFEWRGTFFRPMHIGSDLIVTV